jgi:hypothetical protein
MKDYGGGIAVGERSPLAGRAGAFLLIHNAVRGRVMGDYSWLLVRLFPRQPNGRTFRQHIADAARELRAIQRMEGQ